MVNEHYEDGIRLKKGRVAYPQAEYDEDEDKTVIYAMIEDKNGNLLDAEEVISYPGEENYSDFDANDFKEGLFAPGTKERKKFDQIIKNFEKDPKSGELKPVDPEKYCGEGQEWVKGYYKSDGVFVRGHCRKKAK